MAKPTFYLPPDNTRINALEGVLLASFTRRGIALVIDFVTAGLIFVVITVGGGVLAQKTGLLSLEQNVNIEFTFFKNWYSGVWLVIYFTLSVYFSQGKTIGKKICRIRIVSLVHEHIGLFHCFERALGYGASVLEAGFGFFQYFIRPDRRTIHDRIAETIVIAELKAKSAGKS